MILVLDNVITHDAKLVRAWLARPEHARFRFLWLPKYTAHEHNPIERLAPLAKAGVNVLLIHGDSDKVVPLEQNSAEFAARYKAHGAEGLVKLIVAKGQGHNYWEGFFRSQELVDFAVSRARAGAQPAR